MGVEHWIGVVLIAAAAIMAITSGARRVRKWKETPQQAATDARRFWTFWGAVAVAIAAVWYVFTLRWGF